MTAVMDIPDDLYQKVTRRSAALGRRVPDVTAELYERWLREEHPPCDTPESSPMGTEWLEEWFNQADQAIRLAPATATATARDILNQGRSRLE